MSQIAVQDAGGELEAMRNRVADLERQLAAANSMIEDRRKTAAATARRPFGYVVELRRDQPWPGIRWRRSKVIPSKDDAEHCASEWRKQIEGVSFLEGSDTYIIPLFEGFPADITFIVGEAADLLREGVTEASASMQALLERMPVAITQACENYRKPAKAPSRRSIRVALRRE
ncbi:hypothetical protein O9X98_05735 [Agrobacterium salinitolerans]|nr:hypothetical protein [Agrobacterium salinitolerans]